MLLNFRLGKSSRDFGKSTKQNDFLNFYPYTKTYSLLFVELNRKQHALHMKAVVYNQVFCKYYYQYSQINVLNQNLDFLWDKENLIAAKTFNEHHSAAVVTNLNITRTCPRCSCDVPTMLLMVKRYHKVYVHHMYGDCNWVVDTVCICQGCRRFETSVFFSVKNNISTTGGFRVDFFQPDTIHP